MEDNRAAEQALAQASGIENWFTLYEWCQSDDAPNELSRELRRELRRDYGWDGEDRESVAGTILERVSEDALSVEVRSDWRSPGSEADPAEYAILLCMGGPAVRIVGRLNQWNEPESASLECQDWFTPWSEVSTSSSQDDALLWYASQHYFGP